ncbi:Os01g0141150, partial [Oryza sativa Japonica Group]
MVSPLTRKELRELDRQYDGLLQRLLGALEAGDIVPLDVGLLGDDGGVESSPQLGLLGIIPTPLPILTLGLGPRGDGRVAAVGATTPTPLIEDRADLLGAAEVLGELGGDGLLDLRVLLVLEVGLEVLERVHVERERLDVVA